MLSDLIPGVGHHFPTRHHTCASLIEVKAQLPVIRALATRLPESCVLPFKVKVADGA
jgi:hypothetical protein